MVRYHSFSDHFDLSGGELTAGEFRQRYRRNQRGFDNRSPQHVIDMLKQVEEKRAALGEKATIVMTYRVNGTEPREWRWPPVPTTHQ
jgi:hypothetical protein